MELLQSIVLICFAGGLLALLWKSKRGGGWLAAPPKRRRLELLDRVALTHQHSVHLLSVEGRWMAVAVTPKGVDLLESGPLVSSGADLLESRFTAGGGGVGR